MSGIFSPSARIRREVTKDIKVHQNVLAPVFPHAGIFPQSLFLTEIRRYIELCPTSIDKFPSGKCGRFILSNAVGNERSYKNNHQKIFHIRSPTLRAPNARHHPRPHPTIMRGFVTGRRVHAVVMRAGHWE